MTGMRHLLLFLPLIPQRMELRIIDDQMIGNIFAEMDKWVDIPIEILATSAIAAGILKLFGKDKEPVDVISRNGIVGVMMASSFTVTLLTVTAQPYVVMVLSAFIVGCISAPTPGDYGNLYGFFAIIAGFVLGTFIIYGGLLACVAMILLSVANLVGIIVSLALRKVFLCCCNKRFG